MGGGGGEAVEAAAIDIVIFSILCHYMFNLWRKQCHIYTSHYFLVLAKIMALVELN